MVSHYTSQIYIRILTLLICDQVLQHEKHDLLHSHPSEVEGVRIVVISLRNIAKNISVTKWYTAMPKFLQPEFCEASLIIVLINCNKISYAQNLPSFKIEGAA